MSRFSSRTRVSEEDLPLLSSEQPASGDSSSYSPQHDVLDVDISRYPRPQVHEDRRKLEKRLLKKIDIHMSILVLISIFNNIDRNSTAAARLRGFEDDLGLQGTQFASILSIFFVGYVFMQTPSNMFLSQISKPSVYLPCCAIVWGTISFCTGFVTNYRGALLTRFLLGIVEAGFYPGALFLITKWYKRSELSQRIALFSFGGFISSAFGSLIASGILDVMDGALGYTAWRWLFFVEGGLTVSIAILGLFVLPDFPETKIIPWLTPAEHALARRRMIEDAAGTPSTKPSDEAITSFNDSDATKSLMMALTDWKVWYLALAIFFIIVTTSFSMYFPTLASTMGYNPTITLLLCAPPWLIGAFGALWLSRHSDRIGERCVYIVVSLAIGIGGFLLAMSTMNIAVRYISLFLMVQAYVGSVLSFAWMSSIISNPPAKRAVALAFINSLSQIANIFGSYVWPRAWGPTYNKSYAICVISSSISIAMCLWLRGKLLQLNKEMDLVAERDGTDEGREPGGWRYHI